MTDCKGRLAVAKGSSTCTRTSAQLTCYLSQILKSALNSDYLNHELVNKIEAISQSATDPPPPPGANVVWRFQTGTRYLYNYIYLKFRCPSHACLPNVATDA